MNRGPFFAGGTCPETVEQHIPGNEGVPESDVEVECGTELEYEPGESGTYWDPPVNASVFCPSCGWQADNVEDYLDDGADRAYDDARDARD